MREEIICAGFGGQGIMLLGKLIAFGAMKKALHVTWIPSYGAEVRGGVAHCMVVVSDEEIASPVVSLPDTVIAMNKPSFERFLPAIKPEGAMIVNSSLVDTDGNIRKDINIIEIPMTDIAHKVGNVKTANMVALGAYMKIKGIFSKEDIRMGISEAFLGDKKIADINIIALKKGLKING